MNHFLRMRMRTLCGPALLLASLTATSAFAADDAAQMALGKKLFNTSVPAELKPGASRVSKALRDGLGAMPSFKATLSEAEIAALSYYVARATGAEK